MPWRRGFGLKVICAPGKAWTRPLAEFARRQAETGDVIDHMR